MKCSRCDEKAVYIRPALCKDHLCSLVEGKVAETIDRFDLLQKNQSICVAASGGKDSVTLLAVLKKLGFPIEALAIDEGIKGYRDASLVFLKAFCAQRDIPLNIVPFTDLTGKPLDDMVDGQHPCSICGVFRRYLLNLHAKEYDVIATGHNLDDEAQAVLMNLIKTNKDLLFRSFVKTPHKSGFVQRVKPLMFVPERMITAYSFLQGFGLEYDECPYAQQSLRAKVRDVLNRYEDKWPGMKLRLVEAGLRIAGSGDGPSLRVCDRCGEPSVDDVCRACMLKEELVRKV